MALAELREAAASSSTSPLLLRLQQHLSSCSQPIEDGDLTTVTSLVNFLETINPDDPDAQNNASQILSEIHRFLLSPTLHQEVIDALSFDLPKAVSELAGLSTECLEIAGRIIDRFIEKCSPRDMLSVLCEALARDRSYCSPGYVASLLNGLSKVFLSMQRRQYEQVKVAIPVILNGLKATTLELDDEDNECINLFSKALGVADSMQAVCTKLEGIVNEKLRALLGLYVLQIMALLSLKEGDKISSYLHLVSQLSNFFPHCGFSYLGLITGSDIDAMMSIIVEEDTDDSWSCLSYIKHGASLSVIWGHVYDDVAQAARENISVVKDELKINLTNRWQAVGMLKCILEPTQMPWELKKHAIDFLLCITAGGGACNAQHIDHSIYLPSICTALQVISYYLEFVHRVLVYFLNPESMCQAITVIIIYAQNTELRKNAFEALKRVLADVPTSERLHVLKVLITKSDSSSMIAILLDLARGELHMENCQRTSIRGDEPLKPENQQTSITTLWNAEVLELVEFVLRPAKGGPPPFPEHGDAVLAALNLYRFILMTESAGNTNYTGVMLKDNLHKAYHEWLLPLRTLVAGILAENKNDSDEFAIATVCTLNPVELVLYRCIELVEEKTKHST